MAENTIAGVKGTALGYFQNNRVLVITVSILVIIIVWLFISSGIKVRNVEQAAAVKTAEVIQKSEALQSETVKQSLSMFGMPLAWAVRREMMASNMAQVDQYVTDLVKQKGFQQVVVAKEDGKIAVASDRKHIGAAFSTLYPANYLSAEKITVEDKGAGKWLLVIPVMGLNARLGVVAMEYQVPPAAVAP